ncbi:MAG: hypothetical protein L3J42_05135 [Hydrogenimonas sp.]|nr:hypothetical protein [Hydrogenimonas sp.]
MNADLGRKILALLFFAVLALSSEGASDYNCKISLSKISPYLKEPFVVTFEINQTDSSKVMFFDFDVNGSDKFFVHRLDKKVDEAYHARKERYTYLLFPLKSGKLSLDFKLLVRRGNDEMLSAAFTGGRYNVKAVETDDRYEPLLSKSIVVKLLPVEADLVGSYRVSRKVETSAVETYEPLYIDVKVSGRGFLPDLDRIEWVPPIPGVKIFKDKPVVRKRFTQEGIESEVLFRYALISQKSFKLPKLHLKGFDTKKESVYSIDLQAYKIDVVPPRLSSVLDKKTLPTPVESPLYTIKSFIPYTLIFAAGWISALLALRLKSIFPKRAGEDEWRERVKSSRDSKELLKLLLQRDASKFGDWIDRIERSCYKGEKIDLKAVKREILNES